MMLVAVMLSGGEAAADFAVEGSPGAMVVTASNASRAEVLSAIVDSLGIEAVGQEGLSGEVSGRFEGNLSRVLNGLAPDSGFVISYRGDRPVRIIFSRSGGATSDMALPSALFDSTLPAIDDSDQPATGGETSDMADETSEMSVTEEEEGPEGPEGPESSDTQPQEVDERDLAPRPD
jgi:hypothetical protein